MKQLENIAVKVDGKEQWEQVAAVLESCGIQKCSDRSYNDWDFRLKHKMENQYALTDEDGVNLWGGYLAQSTVIYTFTDFMQKFSNDRTRAVLDEIISSAKEFEQPDPIAELTKRLEALEARVFGNTEQPQGALEPKPETVYDGVFWFEGNGKASCINGKQVMDYSKSDDTWLIYSSEDLPKHRHRLVLVNLFTVGKWYARHTDQSFYINPQAYSMYLGDGVFVGWMASKTYPISIHKQHGCDIQLLEVQPA
jgi:hypothetical protein